MATSRGAGGGAVLGYVASRKNLAGSACGVAGVGLALAGGAGAHWPVVVAALYGAGALIAPPERPPVPDLPDPHEQLALVRENLARLREYLAEAGPAPVGGKLAALLELYEALLDPGWAAEVLAVDPEAVHALDRAIRLDVPECVDTYHRTRWWTRWNPGGESSEQHLERQLAVLSEEAEKLTADLREAEARRQRTHTAYLEERGRS
ncbi:hypothetical protein ACFWUQ_26200 [Streptomyces sp. NPDC058662]|uniref:hypothetical protein n=1 Tax=Streptomyces sp. NPDC058662 TaxID=3346583 RepID=UPI003647442F